MVTISERAHSILLCLTKLTFHRLKPERTVAKGARYEDTIAGLRTRSAQSLTLFDFSKQCCRQHYGP